MKNILQSWDNFLGTATLKEAYHSARIGLDLVEDILLTDSENLQKLKPTEVKLIMLGLSFARSGMETMKNTANFKKKANMICRQAIDEMYERQSSATEPKQEPHLSEA